VAAQCRRDILELNYAFLFGAFHCVEADSGRFDRTETWVQAQENGLH